MSGGRVSEGREWKGSRWRNWLLLGAVVTLGVAIYTVRAVLPPFLVAMVLVYLLNPVVTRIARWQVSGRTMPRVMAAALVLITMLGALVGLCMVLFPALAQEVGPFREMVITQSRLLIERHLPAMVGWLQASVTQAGMDLNVDALIQETFAQSYGPGHWDGAAIVAQAQSLIGGAVHLVFQSILVFILTLFLLTDWPRIWDGFWRLVPERQQPGILTLINALDRDLSGSIRGQLMICVINLVLTTIGLMLLGVKYAVTLGAIAGLFSIVPVFGSIVSTVPIVLVSLTVSAVMAAKAVLVIVVIHLIEANFLNPKVMGHHVELHPVIILFAIFCAEHFMGPIGLLVGVPIAASLRSILVFLYDKLVLEGVMDAEVPAEAQSGALD